MHLNDLPAAYAARVRAAQASDAWVALCSDTRGAAWLAWNVREDFWYGPAELASIQGAIDAAPADLAGPALLVHIAASLRWVRLISPAEGAHLPASGVNHIAASRFPGRYRLAPESAWAQGSAQGELVKTLLPGDRIRVLPKPAFACFAWLTFEANGKPVPKEPDEALRQLGLDWRPDGGIVLRVEVPMDVIRRAGDLFAIPTIFDALDPRPGQMQKPDWRARPKSEHRPSEHWGHARDMQADGPGLPEVIADITHTGAMDAEFIGTPSFDWSTRPFLSRRNPR